MTAANSCTGAALTVIVLLYFYCSSNCLSHDASVCATTMNMLQCLSGGKGVFRVDLGIFQLVIHIVITATLVLNLKGLQRSVFALTAQHSVLCLTCSYTSW